MSETICHHIPPEIIAAYASGSLGRAYALVVAAHASMCDVCRAELTAQEAAGGVVLEEMAGAAISHDLLTRVLDRLDEPAASKPAPYPKNRVYPGPIMEEMNGKLPRWRNVGGGVKQCVICGDAQGVSRLLFIPPGRAVPDHGHSGLELTLVLQGGFSDATGHFDVGDVEVADATLDHVPTADPGPPCIVVAATNAPLRFKSFLPRLFQPFFGI